MLEEIRVQGVRWCRGKARGLPEPPGGELSLCYPSTASGSARTPHSLPMAPACEDGDGTVGQTPARGRDGRHLCAQELCPEGCCQPAVRCWEGGRDGAIGQKEVRGLSLVLSLVASRSSHS